jgi:hypothetical protein
MAVTSIEKAIQDFVVLTSGLDDAHVYYEDGKPRADGTYIVMSWPEESAPANDETGTYHNPLVLADDIVETVDAVTNQLTLTAHAYARADGPVQLTTTGVLPAPLALATNYWIVVDSASKIRLSTTRHNACAGTAIDITDAGTGVHTIIDTPNTRRLGQEIVNVVRGPRRFEIQLQCYSTAPTGTGAARAILSKVVSRSQLPSPIALLNLAGIGLAGFEAIQTVGAVGNFVVFQPRATTTMVIYTSATESETGTNITAAEVTRSINGHPVSTKTYGTVS